MKDRVRISITVRPEILNLLDSRVDGTKIRNRSHAVEHFLRKALLAPTGQAVILVGDEDKPLTDICGETVIEKMLRVLEKAGVSKIVLCCKENDKKLRKFLSKKKFEKFSFLYAKNENKGTAAALYQCKNYLDPSSFIMLYGDVFAEVDAFDLVDFHQYHKRVATMVITSVADPTAWGIVKVKRNRIMDFIEKPSGKGVEATRLTNLINAGIFVFQPEIFSYLNSSSKVLETEIFPQLIKEQQFFSYLLDGVWFNVSRGDQLAHAQRYCTPKGK